MAVPIPLMLFGKFPSHQKAAQDIVRPEFEIIDTVSSIEEGQRILESHLANGTIKAVVMGGGFSNADYEQMRALSSAESVAWLRPMQTKPGSQVGYGAGPPSAEQVSARLRQGLDEHKTDLEEGKGKGETWYF